MALIGLRLGYLNKELPRYQYQRLRWQRRGWQEKPAMLFGISSQGFANMTVLALPAILQANNHALELSGLEIVGYAIWLVAFGFEFIATSTDNCGRSVFGVNVLFHSREVILPGPFKGN